MSSDSDCSIITFVIELLLDLSAGAADLVRSHALLWIHVSEIIYHLDT